MPENNRVWEICQSLVNDFEQALHVTGLSQEFDSLKNKNSDQTIVRDIGTALGIASLCIGLVSLALQVCSSYKRRNLVPDNIRKRLVKVTQEKTGLPEEVCHQLVEKILDKLWN